MLRCSRSRLHSAFDRQVCSRIDTPSPLAPPQRHDRQHHSGARIDVRHRIREQHLARNSRRLMHIESRDAQSASWDNPFPLPHSQWASPYEIFHLSSGATSAEIKSRYYDLVKIYHPDRAIARASSTEDGIDSDAEDRFDGGGAPDARTYSLSSDLHQQAHDDFKRIHDAYSLLGNEQKRRAFDRTGFGWDPTRNTSDGSSPSNVPPWAGGFPRSASEWAAYQAWSDTVRRSGAGPMHGRTGHDRFGWQARAGSDYFYGYGHARPPPSDADQKPRYTTNIRFMMSLSSLTAVLALFQYLRFQQERRYVIGLEDRRHLSAVESLQEARKFARSDAGRSRMEIMRRRAREQQLEPEPAFEDEGDGALVYSGQARGDTATAWEGIVGRGGPSGRLAYEERLRRIEKE